MAVGEDAEVSFLPKGNEPEICENIHVSVTFCGVLL